MTFDGLVWVPFCFFSTRMTFTIQYYSCRNVGPTKAIDRLPFLQLPTVHLRKLYRKTSQKTSQKRLQCIRGLLGWIRCNYDNRDLLFSPCAFLFFWAFLICLWYVLPFRSVYGRDRWCKRQGSSSRVAEIEMRQEYSNFICRRTDMVRGAHVREMTPAGKLSRARVPVWAMRPLTSPSSIGSWLTTLKVYEHLPVDNHLQYWRLTGRHHTIAHYH